MDGAANYRFSREALVRFRLGWLNGGERLGFQSGKLVREPGQHLRDLSEREHLRLNRRPRGERFPVVPAQDGLDDEVVEAKSHASATTADRTVPPESLAMKLTFVAPGVASSQIFTSPLLMPAVLGAAFLAVAMYPDGSMRL